MATPIQSHMKPQTHSYNWNVWTLESETIESFSGYLPVFAFDRDDHASSVIRVDDLRPGDQDPRWPGWVIRSIHHLVESDSLVYYLWLEPEDPSTENHPAAWIQFWPLASDDLDRMADIVECSVGYFSMEGISLPGRPELTIHQAEDDPFPDGCVTPWNRTLR